MSDYGEIIELISTYNEIEAQQTERLKRLFELVKARKGFRRVAFSAGVWSNCWDRPERLDQAAFLDPLARLIVDFELGDEQ